MSSSTLGINTPNPVPSGLKPSSLSDYRKARAKKIIKWFTIVTFGSGYLLYLALRYLFYEMAQSNNLVALRADGEYKAVMRGDTCVRHIMQVEGCRYDPDGYDTFKGSNESYANFLVKVETKKRILNPTFVERKLKRDDKGELVKVNDQYQLKDDVITAIDEANTPDIFEEIFGVVWLGFSPYRVFYYPFRWLKYGQERAVDGVPSENVNLHPRDEIVDSLYYRYPQYGVSIDKAETGAGSLAVATDKGAKVTKIQVKGTLVFETETKNAQKTLFRTAALSSAGDWQQALVKEIKDRVRTWLGSTDWDTLVEDKIDENGVGLIEKKLGEIRDKINAVDEDDIPDPKAPISAVRDYGQKIIKISMPHLDLMDKSLQDASENVFKAERKRDADIADAAGKRALAAAPIQGKADGLKLIGEIPGGKEMFMSEQMGKISVYAPGKDGIFFNISDQVTGKKQPEKPNEDKEKEVTTKE